MYLEEIKSRLDIEKAIALQEEGFRLFSEGKVTFPPVGYMNFGDAVGEVHVKSGWIQGDETFVVKIAGAFHQNPELGLPVIQGIILVFDAKTGQTKAILNDEGYLTNLRTALAGLIAAKYLAPKKIKAIGILGTGIQARLQAEYLKHVTECREIFVWGRNPKKVEKYISEMTEKGFLVHQAKTPAEVCSKANLIVTTTAAKEPLIQFGDVLPGTHITAMGADAPGKQELDKKLFKEADRVVVDSREQCLDHGEVRDLKGVDLVELGEVISSPKFQRTSEDEITIADLTGISVQDIQIAKAVLEGESQAYDASAASHSVA